MNSLRSIWNQMPAVRLLIPFIAGIILCIESPDAVLYPVWIMCTLLIGAVGIIIYVNGTDSAVRVYRWRYASGMAVSVAMLSLGYLVTFFNTDTNDPHHIAHIDKVFVQTKATYIGIICDPPVIRDKTVSTLIQLQKAAKGDTSIPVGGKVLASIAKDSSSETLRYGDRVVFSGVVTLYEEPKNPNQFDYRGYQALHHIFHRVYLRGGDWRVAATAQGDPVLARIYDVRSYFLSLIMQTVHGANELAVATAIMLGYRDYISDEVMQAYSGSGVLHVLSVSGLHVAVLYYVLNILFGWMDRRRKLQIAKGIIVIVIMLFYAGFTGLSPPVLRSVWMFTLITIAKLIDRDVSMYNVLGVSCLVLLIWDPYYAGDVGFQLSYIAVAGIVYLYPLFHKLLPAASFSFRTPFGFVGRVLTYLYGFVWGLICVSIAAQIATFPVSLYYFHSFPNFFLLANLFVIPLSNFVLISGMALFAVGWCHWLLVCVGWIFDHFLIVLNAVVFWIDSLPLALSRGLVVSISEMILCYIVIMMACWFMADRRAKVLLAALGFVLILCTAFSADSIRNDRTHKLIVYDVQGKKAISFIMQRKVYYDFDTGLINNDALMRYNIRDHWWHCGVGEERCIDSAKIGALSPYGRMYAVNGKRVLVIDKELPYLNSSKLKADIVILSHSPQNTINEIAKRIDFKELVFDTSDRPFQVKRWIEECEKLKLKYHDCRNSAFEINL